MPKIINHKEKKEQIIQYAFQSIVENGAKDLRLDKLLNSHK